MCPHTSPTAHHGDGSPHLPPRRFLQIATHSPSRLLRAGQTGRCRSCGNRIDWYQRADNRPIPSHPTAAATTDVPAACRRHTSNGIAYPHDDGSGWCRLPHAAQCPRPPASQHRVTSPRQTLLRRHLTVRSHRLIDTGALTPAPSTSSTLTETTSPDRPVVRILLTPYHAQEPVENIRSIAQTRQRHRCTRPRRTMDPTARPTPPQPPRPPRRHHGCPQPQPPALRRTTALAHPTLHYPHGPIRRRPAPRPPAAPHPPPAHRPHPHPAATPRTSPAQPAVTNAPPRT
ncbi:DUF6083 domain-containing protein [Streptomyces griseoincarnatus]